MRLLVPSFALALLACSGDPPPAETPDDPCGVSGNVCTFSGIPLTATYGAEDIPATESGMYLPVDLTFDPSNNDAYVIDWNNHRIRRIDDQGIIHTVAGSGFLGDGPPGPSLQNAFNHPTNLNFSTVDPTKLAIAAWHNSRIELLDVATLEIEWIGGTGARSYNGDGQKGPDTEFDLPSAVAFDDQGDIYITDQANQLLRVLDTGGVVHDVGGHQRVPGYRGDGGPVKDAEFHGSTGQAADPSNRIVVDGTDLYMVDSGNHVVRRVDLVTMLIDTVAGVPYAGYEGDGGDALDARFSTPRDLALGLDGELYIADTDNNCIRVVRDGVVDRFAGQCGLEGAGYGGDGAPALDAQFEKPFGIAVDLDGNVYVADTYNHVIRRITR